MVRKKQTEETSEIPVQDIPDVTTGRGSTSGKLPEFPALRNKNYRFFFTGQFISVIGTWMQIVAQGWLVLQLTTSAAVIGIIAGLATAPSLLFSLFGGVIVDRFDKKNILYLTQVLNMLLALFLGTMTLLDLVTIPLIGTVAFLMGTVNAIDAPARQAFVSTIVTREQLASAIALNSGIFNAARAAGPAVSGILIATVGTGLAFILNGVSYIALIIALAQINYKNRATASPSNPLRLIREGINYSFGHPLIKVLVLVTAMLSIFAWSYSTLIPLLGKTIFGVQSQGLGYMYTATGLGALFATYMVGAFSQRISPVVFITTGNIIFSISLILFAFADKLVVALPLLFFIGMGLLSQGATINTLIQTVVREDFRGRVMSIYVLMFLGMAPIGNIEIGLLSESLSIRSALILNGCIVLVAGAIVFSFRNRIRDAYRTYSRNNPLT